ncbi:MAG: FAD-dependent oxidoreductase, partial [Bacteroidota bacterium]
MVNKTKKEHTRVVIIGGGFAGIELVKKLRRAPVQVTLIDRNNYFTFQPLLYQVAMGGLEPSSVSYPYRTMFRGMKNVKFKMANVDAIDYKNKLVNTNIGDEPYDFLVIATGSKPNFFGLDDEHLLSLKTIPQAREIRNWMLKKLEQANVTAGKQAQKNLLNIVIVGGGPTGVELAGALGELKKIILPKDFPDLDPKLMEIHIVEGKDQVLGGMSKYAGENAASYLESLGVRVHLSTRVNQFENGIVKIGEEEIIADQIIWTAGVAGNTPDGIESKLMKNGRVQVN